MKLFDFFLYKEVRTYPEYLDLDTDKRPMWQNKSESAALRSVEKINDQELLSHIAQDSNCAAKVRECALGRINSAPTLSGALRNWHLRWPELHEKFLQRLDEVLMDEVAYTTNVDTLVEMARSEGPFSGSNAVRFAAVDRIDDLEVLEAISADQSIAYTPVRVHADERIKMLKR
jgi:hypothetical protein